MRQRKIPEWHIANVTVLPAHRRRGIARKLVEKTLEELRNRNTKTAFLEVVIGNDPALKLYEEVGFEVFTQALQYHYQSDVVIMPPVIPQGYTLKPLGIFDWQTRYQLEKRVTPEHITRYEAVTEDHYRAPFVFPLFGQLFEKAGGNHTERFAIFSPTGEVVGVRRFKYRTKPGGMNNAQVNIEIVRAGRRLA